MRMKGSSGAGEIPRDDAWGYKYEKSGKDKLF